MKDKKIVVLLKYFKGELNPFDGAALECALKSGARDIIALTMAPKTAFDAFRSLTRLGVKGVFVTDSIYAGSDTQATSRVLCKAIEKLNPDLVFCGRQSVDGDTAQVPAMLAQRLGFDIKVKVTSIDGKTIITRKGEKFIVQEKTILTFEKNCTLRFPSIFSKIGEVEVWDNAILGLKNEECGLLGSPTRVVKSYESEVGRRNCVYKSQDDLSNIIKSSLQKNRTFSELNSGEKLDKVYYVGNVAKIANEISTNAISLVVADKSAEQIACELKKLSPCQVLWEDSDEIKELASRVAVLTDAGLCADCISFRVEDGKFIMTRPAQGGSITADIICTSPLEFATVRTVKENGSDVIFSIGKGAIEDIEHIKELAKEFNAEICCSRIVADSGKLPYETQVGLTGKTVSPKVYVAFGISGAVQHTCAISGAGTIIAVNTDKNSRIFDYADYGIIVEVKNVKL